MTSILAKSMLFTTYLSQLSFTHREGFPLFSLYLLLSFIIIKTFSNIQQMNIKGIAQITIGNNCFHKCNPPNKIKKTHGYKQDRMLSGKVDAIIIYPTFKTV